MLPLVRCVRRWSVDASEVMARQAAYRLVQCPDGRFAVVAVLASGSMYRRSELSTLAEAEVCLETLRVLMEACGVSLERWEGYFPLMDQICSSTSPSRTGTQSQ